jgi:hypothetical protein
MSCLMDFRLCGVHPSHSSFVKFSCILHVIPSSFYYIFLFFLCFCCKGLRQSSCTGDPKL